MAWSWSHTQEAYDYARFRLTQLTNDQLVEIYAEWFAHVPGAPAADHDGCVASRLPIGVIRASGFTRGQLEDVIWNYASEQATCDNGGWNAWVCPYGCHTVPFSGKEE